MKPTKTKSRRDFLRASGVLGAGLLLPIPGFASENTTPSNNNIHEFGKREGYSDQLSILVSMMDWMRSTVLRSVDGLSQKDLDFLLDKESNSIGAMLIHLAATERFYQIHTFDGRDWGDWDEKDADRWQTGMSLGTKAQKEIKGHSLSYYKDQLAEVREFSLEKLKSLDDSWLMKSTTFFGGQPTNNYCKWFHVVEHESNHNGQMKFIKSRIS